MKLFKNTGSKLSINKIKILPVVYSILVYLEFVLPVIIFILPFIKVAFLERINGFIFKTSSLFVAKIDTFATISTVLVGVYFSLLTLLLTIDGKSMLTQLNKDTLKKISKELGFALFLTSIYMFSPLLVEINSFINDVVFSVFLLIFLQVIKVGIYFFIIINTDLSQRITSLQKDKEKEDKMYRMVKKLYDKVF